MNPKTERDAPPAYAQSADGGVAYDPVSASEVAGGSCELQPEDFYFEGPYMVFTAAYHLRRGYCCNSECRHCPYR